MAESTILITLLVAFVCMVLLLVVLVVPIVAVVWFLARSTNNADGGGINFEFKPNFSSNNSPTLPVCPSCENLRSGSSIEGRESTRCQLRQRSQSRSPKTSSLSSENAMSLIPVQSYHRVKGNGAFDCMSRSSSSESLTEKQIPSAAAAAAGLHDKKEERRSIDLERQVKDLTRAVSSIQEELKASRILTAQNGGEAEDTAKFESTGSDRLAVEEGFEIKTPFCEVIIPAGIVGDVTTMTVHQDHASPSERARRNGRFYISPDIVFDKEVYLNLDAKVKIHVSYVASDIERPVCVQVESLWRGQWWDIGQFSHKQDNWVQFREKELGRFAVFVEEDQFERMSRKLSVIVSQKKSLTGKLGEDLIRWNIFDGNQNVGDQLLASLRRDGFVATYGPEPIFVRHGRDILLYVSRTELHRINIASKWGLPVNVFHDFFTRISSPESLTIVAVPGYQVIFDRPNIRHEIPDATRDEIVSVSRPTGRRRSLRSEILITPQASEFEFSSSSAGNSSDSDARRHGRTSPASEISSTSSRSGHSDASSTDSGYNFYFPRQSFPQPQPRGPEEQEARNPVRVRDSIPPSFTTDDEKISARSGRDRDENAGAKEQSEAAGLSRSSSCSSMSRPRWVHEPAIEAECLGVNRADVMTDLEEEEEEEEKKEEEEDSDEEY